MESTETDGFHLLQRPESSGTDVSDFSFAKPSSNRKPFSLRNIPKQPSIAQNTVDDANSATDSAEKQVITNEPSIRPNTPCDPHSNVRENTFNAPTPTKTPLLAQHPRRLSMVAGSGQANSGSRPSTVRLEHSSTRKEQEALVPWLDDFTEAVGPSKSSEGALNTTTTSQASSDFQKPYLRMPLKPVNTQRTSKIQIAAEKETLSKHQTTNSASAKKSVQLSENDLFEQLIERVKEREESQQSATAIKQQIEADNRKLKEANHTLQERLKKHQAHLVKATSDNKNQRAQLDQCKGKIGTFKGVLNEFVREYERIRGQAIDVKETIISLNREKEEIQASLSDLRMQLSKNVATIEGQRGRLAASDATIAGLKEALEHAEERSDLIKAQLTSERKRIVTLETYIQNESQSQARCLGVVRKEQSNMTEKLDNLSSQFSKACLETQDAIVSMLGPEIERCVNLSEDLKTQYCAEAMDVKRLTTNVQDAGSRLESMAGQFTSDLDRSNEVGKNVLQALQEGLQSIESHCGPYSTLVKQLANNENCYSSLQYHVQTAEPVLGSLTASVKAVEARETELIHELQGFTQMLSEARIPAGNPVLENELTSKFAENTQLQLQLQQVSNDVQSLREQVSGKASENQRLQHALAEIANAEREQKDQVARLNIENTSLKGELGVLEQRIREELNTVGRKAQDEMRTKFEYDIQALQTAKVGLEQDSNTLQFQLSSANNSLTESKKLAERDRLENESKIHELQRRIDELNNTCSEYAGQVKATEVEARVSKCSEASLHLAQQELMRQLEQAHQKSRELETHLALKNQSENIKQKEEHEFETKLKSLEVEAVQRAEELQATKQSLEMFKSRSAALEKTGEEADAEIVSLLRRAQEAESWQVTIGEGFAKVTEMHSGQPFEQTWQQIETILPRLMARASTGDPSSVNDAMGTRIVDDLKGSNNPTGLKESHDDKASATGLDKRPFRATEDTQAVEPLSPKACSSPKSVNHTGCVDSIPKFAVGHSQIVPFSSVQDRISQEDSLPFFNDTAELEMLMMSTPDLQGYFLPKSPVLADAPTDGPEDPRIMTKSEEIKTDTLNSARIGDGGITSGRSKSAVAKAHDSFANEATESEQFSSKRKAVSFEGTNVFTQTEVGQVRRMSDATDNSCGGESESKELKRTQKRTYSRLRQSVAPEETTLEPNSQPQLGTKDLPGLPQQASQKTTEHTSPPQKLSKRPRKAGDGPGRRLSPKGLASGSSRTNVPSQTSNARGRVKRRTRGDRYNQRFSQDAG